MNALDRVVLSWPTLLTTAAAKENAAPRSWVQIARTGSFVSNRYGTFSITRDDLSMMLKNFEAGIPQAPTELPIDYDHLSMDPKQPGDGIAAGWMKRLELREDGTQLFAEIEWTADGARRIRNKEYRFVSPSFVKDHTHKDGTKIGTTLLAAAVTNHPFLEGMRALTLYSFSAMGDLAMLSGAPKATPVHLACVGQRVTLAQAAERTVDERAMTFVVAEVSGAGDDGFVFVQTLAGKPFGWFRATQLGPARATLDPTMEDKSMSAENPGAELLTLANKIAGDRRCDFRGALLEAARQRPDLAHAHIASPDLRADPPVAQPEPTADTVAGTLLTLASTIAKERGISLRAAIGLAARQQPAAVSAYGEAFNTGVHWIDSGHRLNRSNDDADGIRP